MNVIAASPLPWYVARACGLTAWALAWASVVMGLALSTRALGRRPKAPWLNDLHRFLGGLTVIFVAVHVGALLSDRYVPFTPEQVLVPYATHWKPGAVAWGIAAFYLLRGRRGHLAAACGDLPRRLWKGVHFSSYAMAVAASLHLLTAGTDAHIAAVRWAVLSLMAATAFFIFYRLSGPGRRASVAASEAVGPPRPAQLGGEGSEVQGDGGAAVVGSTEVETTPGRLGGAPGDVEAQPRRSRPARPPVKATRARSPGRGRRRPATSQRSGPHPLPLTRPPPRGCGLITLPTSASSAASRSTGRTGASAGPGGRVNSTARCCSSARTCQKASRAAVTGTRSQQGGSSSVTWRRASAMISSTARTTSSTSLPTRWRSRSSVPAPRRRGAAR